MRVQSQFCDTEALKHVNRVCRSLAPSLSCYSYHRYASIHVRFGCHCSHRVLGLHVCCRCNTLSVEKQNRQKCLPRHYHIIAGSHWLCENLQSYRSEPWEPIITPLFSRCVFAPRGLFCFYQRLGFSFYTGQELSTGLIQTITPERHSPLCRRLQRRVSVWTTLESHNNQVLPACTCCSILTTALSWWSFFFKANSALLYEEEGYVSGARLGGGFLEQVNMVLGATPWELHVHDKWLIPPYSACAYQELM